MREWDAISNFGRHFLAMLFLVFVEGLMLCLGSCIVAGGEVWFGVAAVVECTKGSLCFWRISCSLGVLGGGLLLWFASSSLGGLCLRDL